MKFILGKKLRMSQMFSEDGVVTPVTVLEAPVNIITQVKTVESDGYHAVQVGVGARREKNISKAVKGHLKGAGPFTELREFRLTEAPTQKVGDAIIPTVFTVGDVVEVSSTTKGRGFQGVVKRHGFHGGPRTHGQKHSEREPGSIGGGLRTRVPKGMRMAGRMGGNRVTVKNLRIVGVSADAGKILVSGAVPGRAGTIVEIRG